MPKHLNFNGTTLLGHNSNNINDNDNENITTNGIKNSLIVKNNSNMNSEYQTKQQQNELILQSVISDLEFSNNYFGKHFV